MELIRRIVLDVADSNQPLSMGHWENEQNKHDKVGYHIRMLSDEGYLKASILNAGDDPYYFVRVTELTWKGQDLADTIRSQAVWDEVKKRLVAIGESAAISVVKDLAIHISKVMLGIAAS